MIVEEYTRMNKSRHHTRIAIPATLFWSVVIIICALPLTPLASAQGTGISFANPDALTVSIDAGDDFATTVLGDPWDMDRARDIQFEVGFTNISATDGIWSATTSGVDMASGNRAAGHFYPLFQGFSSPIPGGLSQELPLNKFGAQDRYAINAGKYTRLSYRMSVSPRSAQAPWFVHWTTAKPVFWPQGENRFGQVDACQGTTAFHPWNGWHVYNFDLTRPNGEPAVRAGAWQGVVRGLRIDPFAVAQSGVQVKLDWIRLSDPTSAPTITIPWNVVGAAAGDRVDLYVADNPEGRDAAPLAYGLPVSAGGYNLATSILPPGQHYFQLRLKDGAREYGCTVTKATSAWIGPLTIRPVPIVTFAAPSMLSGPDYAASELGQPWEMMDRGDIIAVNPVGWPATVADMRFDNGILTARSVYHPAVADQRLEMSDSQLWLRVDPQRPIDTTYYRYFSIRFKVDIPPGKDLNWAIQTGWGGRVFWWDQNIQQDGSETKYGTYYEGWNVYSIDLARAFPPLPLSDVRQADNILTPREESWVPAQAGWTQIRQARTLRFDPTETTPPAVGTGADVFQIDWIRLTADDEVARGQSFDIVAGMNLPPDSFNVSFFYTTDPRNPTQNPAQSVENTTSQVSIGATGPYRVHLPHISSGNGDGNRAARVRLPVTPTGYPITFRWDTRSVPQGSYYLCARVESVSRAYHYCSETPVNVR